MADFYSGWLGPPNGFAKYRLRLSVNVASQDVTANTSTLKWSMTLEKDRSQNGFYSYNATWRASINGVQVSEDSGLMPPSPWTGWGTWTIDSGTLVVAHDADGNKSFSVTATYIGANTGWAIGTVTTVGNLAMNMPAIPRSTIPTVSPSPAGIGSIVTINLPRASTAYTHDIYWESGAMSGAVIGGAGASTTWTVPDVFNTPSVSRPDERINMMLNPGWETGTAAQGAQIGDNLNVTTTVIAGAARTGSFGVRRTSTIASGGSIGYGQSSASVLPGTYTASLYVRSNVARSVQAYMEGSAARTGQTTSGTVTLVPNEWTRIWFKLTVTTAGTLKPGFYHSGTFVVGDYVELDDFLVESGTELLDYFDGTTVDTTAYDYAWTGTANASNSIATLKTQFQIGAPDLRTNLALNPSFDTSATNWSTNTAPAVAGVTWDNATGRPGARALGSVKTTWASGGSAATQYWNGAVSGMPAVVAGDTITFSAWVKASAARAGATIALRWRDETIAEVASQVSVAASIGVNWTRFSITAVVPTGVTRVHPGINFTGVAGDILWVDDVLIEDSGRLLNYFDGSTPDTSAYDYAWSGAVNNSVSTGALKQRVSGNGAAPIALTIHTRNGATVLGNKQITLLARDSSAPTVTLSDRFDPISQFDVRARLVRWTTDSGRTEWAAREHLPAATITLVDQNSGTATCTIGVSKLNPVDYFSDYSIVDIDTFDGNKWNFTNHRFVLSRTETDDLDLTRTANYTGTEYVDYMLQFAYFQDDYRWDGSKGSPGTAATDDSEGTPPTPPGLAPTTPGEMMRGVIQDAQKRGWGPRIGITFDMNKTSLGEPWANKNISRVFNRGTPGSQVLQSLVEEGLVEYRTEYRNNKAWLILLNPGTGSDYAADQANTVVNFSLANLTRAPRRSTMEKRLTSVTVAGDEEVQITRTRAPFDANVFGVMEGWVSASGIKTNTEARKVGDAALRDNFKATSERTFEYDAQSVASQFYPYSYFRPGDWVMIPDGSNTIKDRVSQVTINKGADGTSLTVLTGDRILSGTASLAKRQSAQSGGSINGGAGTTPATVDSRIPNEPVISTVTSLGYWNSDGAAKSAVTLTWAPVTVSLSGGSIAVTLYEVWWRPANTDIEWSLRGTTDQRTLRLTGFDVQEGIDFRVRGRSKAGIWGEFSEDFLGHITAAPAVDLSGPIITDLYTDGVGSIFIVWAGILGTTAAPKRMAYVTGEISTDGGTTYTTVGTPITAAGTIIVNPKAWGDFMVRLRPYDRLGNPGTSSASQSITLTDPHIDSPVPAAPTTFAATASAGWDASGFFPEAWFNLSWAAPTLDILGQPIQIAGYDVLGLGEGETVERVVVSTSSADTTARFKVGNGETWSLRVRAASIFGGLSVPSNAVTVTADATIVAAPAPVAPTLAQYAGLLRIKWAGGGMQPQIKYVYAAISSTLGGTYTRAGMPLNGAGEVVVPGLAPGPYFAKIVMVDELGTLSTSAASSSITLLPITGVTIQTSELANTGIKLTSGSLTSYDVSGNPTFILNAATGEVWIAPYDSVFDLGAPGTIATTGAPTTGIAISSQNSSFNTFIHPSGVEIRNDQTALSWWEADAADASLVNFFSPRAVIGQRIMVGDFEMLREAKATGSRLVIRYKGA